MHVFESLLGDFNELRKAGGIVHSQVSEHLAVHINVLLLQAIHERDRKSVV